MSKSVKKQSAKGSFYRNTLAKHPLMKKGGVHEKSQGAKRKRDKQQLKQALRKQAMYSDKGTSPFFSLPLLAA